jgi:hypothetical protein
VDQRINLSIRHPYSCGDPLVERLLSIPEVNKLYRSHLEKFISTSFEPAKVHASIDAIANAVRDAVVEEGKVVPEQLFPGFRANLLRPMDQGRKRLPGAEGLFYNRP